LNQFQALNKMLTSEEAKALAEAQKKYKKVNIVESADGELDLWIDYKLLEYRHGDFNDYDLWEQYRDDFHEFSENTFKLCNTSTIRMLRNHLRSHGVHAPVRAGLTMAHSLHQVAQAEEPLPWTPEAIKDYFTKDKLFSPTLNLKRNTNHDFTAYSQSQDQPQTQTPQIPQTTTKSTPFDNEHTK
jgi:hypothetical protein